MKLTFAKGALLKDPTRSLQLEPRRKRCGARSTSHEGETVDAAAFKALVREAVALNGARKAKPAKAKPAPAQSAAPKTAQTKRAKAKPARRR